MDSGHNKVIPEVGYMVLHANVVVRGGTCIVGWFKEGKHANTFVTNFNKGVLKAKWAVHLSIA